MIAGNITLIIIINFFIKKYEVDKHPGQFYKIFRYWYPVFMILVCFKEIYLIMIYSTSGILYDTVLIEIDRAIFGTDPTHFLYRFANPVLTEFMQIIYSIFYFLPIIIAFQLYITKRYIEFKYSMFVIFLGFYLSYIGYLLVPAIGPRFFLHDFHATNLELPGIYLTEMFRNVINAAESIPMNVQNPEDYAQRDAFPSGHTIIIIIVTYLAHKFDPERFKLYFIYCVLMIISTVYLRYHYVIDLIAAVPVVVVTILLANYLYAGKLSTSKK